MGELDKASAGVIGTLVGHIVEAGFDVWVHQSKSATDTQMFILSISAMVGEEVVDINWALLPEYQLRFSEHILMQECEDRLHLLRQAIAEKGKDNNGR